MKKRVLSLLMALTLCLTTLPTAAFAEGEDVSISGGVIGDGETGGEGGGIYAAPGSPTEGGGGTYILGEDTRTEIWCDSKPDSIGRSYDGTTDGGTISLGTLGFTDGENSYTLTEGTGFTAKKTFDSADAGSRTVTVEITLIGDAATKYKLKAGKETFKIGGNIDKAYPNLTVSLSKTTCTVGEKLLPLLFVEGAPEGAAVTYYYAPINSGYLEFEGSEAVPAIDGNTAISEPGTYYVYAKTGETKNYKEERSATVELTVNEAVVEAASVTKADGTDGGTYESLPAALAAARDGDTVKLLANHTTNWSDVEAGEYATLAVVKKTLTLDLNGMTVDYLTVGDVVPDEEGGILESYDGNLTVADNAQGGSCGKIKDLEFVKGSLAIQGGRIGDSLTCNGNSGSVTISGGRVLGLTVGEGASVTVSGGSEHAGNWHNDGTLNITGGTFGNVTFCNNGGTIAISGGTFSTIRNTDASATIAPISLLAPGHAFYDTYNENTVKDGSKNTPLTNVTVKEHTHTMVNNKCACGLSCTHTNTEGASTIGQDGKCTACGTQFAAVIGETYYTDVPAALNAARDGDTVKLLANEMLPSDTYVSKTLTLDLNGHSLSGYGLNVGGLTATSQVRTGNLTVVDSSGGNGAVGVTVRNGGTLVFNPENDNTTLLQLEVWGGTVELYGGKISRSGLRLNNNITLGNLLPGGAGLAYYRGDTQLTLEQAASQTCDLVVKSCSHGGKNGFDNSSATCPYCNAPAVAQTALKKGEYDRLWRNFANLQDALDADRVGGAELTLLADVTGDYTIDGTQDTGLDLNGHSINGTLDVKAVAEGKNYTTTLSNTKNTTTASINEVVAHSGAKLAGSGYPAVIGKLWLADTTKWEYILSQPDRLGFKVLNEDGTHKWYAPTDKSMPAPLENVIINDLPITSKNLSFKVDGTNVKGNKVERGTTVQLCASCNAKDAEVYIYTGVPAGDGTFTYSQKKAEYKMIGKNWYYVVDFAANTVGKYSIYFTASKDGYSVTSNEKKLTVTKASIPESAITAPTAVTGSVYSRDLEHYLVQGGSVDAKYGTMQYSLDRRTWSNTVPTAKDAGTYSVYYKVAGAEGYEDSKISDPITVTIAPKELRITGVTFEEKTYDGVTYVKPTKAIFDDDGANKELELGDYSLSVTLKSTDAGTNVPFTATVKLKDSVTNYTLPNGTYYGFGEIKKAAAPTAQPGTLNVINGTQLTYTYDFKQLLPDVRYGSYGTVSYYCNPGADITLVQQSGYYLDETTVEFDNGVLTLAGLYAKDGEMTGQIGTVKVKVTTTNYEDFQLTLVLNAVNQTKPTPDGEITASNITYGQTLNESTITGKMKDPVSGETVNGTFAWKNGTVKPDAGSYDAEWTFNPDSEEYATVTDTATVEVAPKSIEGAVITLEKYEFAYNAAEQSPKITGVTLENWDETGITYIIKSGDKATNANDSLTLSIEGTGNYTGKAAVEWRITPRVVTAPAIELSGTEFTYTGSAIEPTVTVKDDLSNTIDPKEYTVSYSGNTNAGTATVTVTDKDGGNYTVSGSTRFTIKPAALTGVSVTQDGALTYNGTAQAATVKTSATAKGDQSVTFTYSTEKDGTFNAAVPSFTNAGTHTVWYKAEANNHETASGSFTVSIAAKAVNATIELSGAPFTYTGSAIEPTATVKDGGTTISPSEYTVSYSANTNAGTATVTVTNRDGGNYTVSGSTTFEIQKADPTVTEAPAANSLIYSGSAQALVTAGTASGGKMQYRLGESGNFSTDIPTAKDAGMYKVYYMVKGDSNHKDTGAVELTVTINKAALESVSVKQDGALTYNGTAQTATVKTSATAKGDQSVTFTYSATEDGTFNAAVPSFTDAGSHTVWYKAKANNHETESGSFDVTISKAALESVSVVQNGTLTYNGSAQTATVKTSATAKGGQSVTFTYSATENGTFNAAVPSFTNAGTHTVWYKAEANNHETASGSFTVSIAAKAVTVTVLDKRVYVGAAAPDLTKPEEGKDYTVEGLLGGDKLTTIPTLTYDPAPKTHRANKDTKIVASAADAGGNYEISYVPGTLAVVDVPDTGKPLEPHPVNTPAQSENGAVSANPKEATRGTNVIVSVKPDEGCRLGDLTVVDENGNALEVVDRGNGQYVFVMPDGAVTIRASFVRDGASETSPFRDVSTDAYYYKAVKWAVDRGVTGGIGDGLFGPNQSCTRAQIVTFLWRAAGSPEPKSAAAFADVPAGAYYAKAVAWAVENGITTGTSETTFSPNAACTRAQSVTFLFRALGKLTESGETFRDVPKGSYYEDAVAWAAANGITTGIGGGLFGPNQSCTRAQIVTFLYRAYQGR